MENLKSAKQPTKYYCWISTLISTVVIKQTSSFRKKSKDYSTDDMDNKLTEP